MPQSPVALVALHAAAVTFAAPNAVFCLAVGVWFGLLPGMFCASLGTFLGALGAFGVGRLVARRWAARRLERFPGARLFLAELGGAGVRLVALARLSPLVPFAVQNYGWAVTGVRFRSYALGSLLSIPVGAGFFAHLGAAGRAGASLAADRFSWSALLTVAGLAATFLLIRRLGAFADRALEAAGGPDPPPVR